MITGVCVLAKLRIQESGAICPYDLTQYAKELAIVTQHQSDQKEEKNKRKPTGQHNSHKCHNRCVDYSVQLEQLAHGCTCRASATLSSLSQSWKGVIRSV